MGIDDQYNIGSNNQVELTFSWKGKLAEYNIIQFLKYLF